MSFDVARGSGVEPCDDFVGRENLLLFPDHLDVEFADDASYSQGEFSACLSSAEVSGDRPTGPASAFASMESIEDLGCFTIAYGAMEAAALAHLHFPAIELWHRILPCVFVGLVHQKRLIVN